LAGSTIDVAQELPGEGFVHPALLYSGTAEYLEGTVPFVLDGLAAGEPVAVAVPEPNLTLLRRELGSAADRVRLLDMGVVGRNPGRILADVLHASADPHPDRHVRIIGEPIWPGRTGLEYPACVQHEALINLAFRGRRVTILCPYDAARLDPEVLSDAVQTHPVLVERGLRRDSDGYGPEQAIARQNVPLPEPAVAETFHFDLQRLGAARAFATRVALAAGLGGDRLADFLLAVGELAANSVSHGGGRGVLRIWTDSGHLVGEVADRGRLTDPLAGRRRPAPGRIGGRGLLIVHSVADLVRVYSGPDGTRTRVLLRL
jgi:anti-sigma regulatory factor (Ser/Thr protein kinase)